VSGPPISEPAATRWAEYRDAVVTGLPRARVTDALERLIAAVDAPDREALATWFFRDRYDRRGPDLARRSAIGLLARDVLIPGLLAGARAGGADHLRWLALALDDWSLRLPSFAEELYERSRPAGLLAAALARNPEARDLWRRVFWRCLDIAYWGGHHMGDGSLILSEEECRAALADARAIQAAAPDGALDADDDLAELADLEAVYAAFFAWRDAGKPGSYTGPIPRWVPFPPPAKPIRR
jgi:hypothetical protein